MRARLVLAAVLVATFAAAACDKIAGVRELTYAPNDAGDEPTPDVVDAAPDAVAEDSGAWTAITPDGSPARIVVDDAYLYWITNDPKGGVVAKMPLDGGPWTTLATHEPTPNNFAQDDTYLYVTTGQGFGDGLVKRIRKDGTEELSVASGLSAPQGVVADDAGLYWVDLGDGGPFAGRVVAAAKDGGGAREIVSNVLLPSGLAYDDAFLYFTTLGFSNCDGTGQTTGTIERVARDGGAHATLADGQDCPSGIFVHDTRVFWTNASSGHGTVSVVPKSPDAGIDVLATRQPLPATIASDGTHVFWTNAVVPNGTVIACTIARCDATSAEIAKGQLGPISTAIDRAYLYWATLGVGATPGQIQRYPLAQVP